MVVVTSAVGRGHGARSRGRDVRRGGPHRRGHRFSPKRQWHAAERVGLVGLVEPRRLEITAAIQQVRLSEGKARAGDDRLEAHMCALMHVLYVKAHEGPGSAHFATSYEQIMAALAQRFGIWGPAPAFGSPEREAWVKDHRPRLYDWLELGRRAGLIAGGGVVDNADIWWRTEITVLGVPANLSREALRSAQARIASFPDRERDRMRRGRHTPWKAIFAKAKPPTKLQKQRAAIAKAQAKRSAERSHQSGNSGGPVSPSLPSEAEEAPKELSSNQTSDSPYRPLDRTGVRGRTRPGKPEDVRRLRRRERNASQSGPDQADWSDRESTGPVTSEGRHGAQRPVRQRGDSDQSHRQPRGPVSAVERAIWVEEGVAMAQTLRHGSSELDLTDSATLEAITRAFYLARYGEDEMMRRLPWCPRPTASSPDQSIDAMRDAFELYRRNIAARLPGMPRDPVAALMRMASTPLPPYEVNAKGPNGRWKTFTRYPQRPDQIGYAIRGLRMLARDMAAANTLLTGQTPSIRWADRYQQPKPGRLDFRKPQQTWDETTDERRERLRDQLIAAGGNPRQHDTTESMELELIDREHHDLLPHQYSHPSPTAMRAHRGAWMPAWYTPTPAPDSPNDAWNHILQAAEPWISLHNIETWLHGLTPIELSDDTLTLAGPRHIVDYVQRALGTALEEITHASGAARRLRIVALDSYTGAKHCTPPPPPRHEPAADGKHARAKRHLRRIDEQRKRVLAERDHTITDTELLARRRSETPQNRTWDQLLDIAATRPEFRGTTVVNLWLRPLLPHFGNDGILTLYGHDATIETVRKHLGSQLTHLLRTILGGESIRWCAIDVLNRT